MVKRVLIILDRLHWLWLILATPFLLFPSPSRSLAMLVVPGLILLRWLALRAKRQVIPRDTQATNPNRQSVIPFTPLNGALLLLMLMVLVSLRATFDINFSFPKISGIILGLGIFFVFAREGQSPRGWWLCFLVFMAIGVGITIIGVLGTHWVAKVAFLNPIISRLSPRITGLPGAEEGFNQNSVAGALLWVIPSFCALCWLLLTRAKELRGLIGRMKTIAVIVLTIGATLWTMATLVLTQSREGYIGLALTLPVLTLIALPAKKRWYGLAITAFLVIIVGVFLVLHWGTVRSWLVGSDLTTNSMFSPDLLQGRLEVWSGAIYGIRDFPYIGMGMNTFRKVVLVLYPLPNISADIGHAHNEFLQAALDLGIPGLIAFIAVYIAAFWMLIRTWQVVHANGQPEFHKQNPLIPRTPLSGKISVLNISPLADVRLVKLLVLGLGGGLLAHLLWGLTDAMALGARPAFVFWIILGLISGLHQQTREIWPAVEGNVSTAKPKDEMRK